MLKEISQQPQFSDPELERIKRYGQALGGVTSFDEEVERHLEELGSHERHEANFKKMRGSPKPGLSLAAPSRGRHPA
jgi:hypothetical protein